VSEHGNDRKDELRSLTSEVLKGQLSRREMLRRAAMLGLSASGMATLLAACGDDEEDARPTQEAVEAAPTEAADAAPTEEDEDATPTEGDSSDAAPTATTGGSTGSGEEREIIVGAWAGTFANVLRDTVAPIMKEQFNATLLVEEGVSSDQLAKMRAEESDPKHTVMFVDDNIVQIAKQAGLISELTQDMVPNLANVYPEFIFNDSYGVGVAVSWVAAYYNTDRITEEPTSYEAWWNPDYKGRVAIPDTKISPGIQFLIAAAAVATGTPPEEAQYEIDAGFEKLVELKDSWHSIYTSFNNVTPQLASGEVWLAFGHSRIMNGWILDGAPVKRAPVKEGPFAGINSVVLVEGGPHPDLGAELINIILSEDIQTQILMDASAGSVNVNVSPPEDLAHLIPSGTEEVAKMNNVDWDYANEHREEWAERFNREVIA
jgi:putative spermidine/putrescine transport system substrate-binding protein